MAFKPTNEQIETFSPDRLEAFRTHPTDFDWPEVFEAIGVPDADPHDVGRIAGLLVMSDVERRDELAKASPLALFLLLGNATNGLSQEFGEQVFGEFPALLDIYGAAVERYGFAEIQAALGHPHSVN